MKILVSCKQVPDPDIKAKIGDDGKTISNDGMKWVPNYFDEIACEEALRITKKTGGDVIVMCVGEKASQTQIRKMLAMGAISGIQCLTANTEEDDGAYILAKIVEREQPDLVIMGKQSTDNDAGQAGQILAEMMGWPQACYASKVDVDGDKVTVTREVDGGLETVDMTLPAVITCDLRLNEPRYTSLPNIMKAKKKKIETLSPADLGVDETPKTRIVAMTAPPERAAGVIVKDVDELVAKLRDEAKVL